MMARSERRESHNYQTLKIHRPGPVFTRPPPGILISNPSLSSCPHVCEVTEFTFGGSQI